MKNLSWKILLFGNIAAIVLYALNAALADSWGGFCWKTLYYSHVIGVVIAYYANPRPFLSAALSHGLIILILLSPPYTDVDLGANALIIIIMQAGLAAGVWIAPHYRKVWQQLRAKFQARQG